MDEPEIPDFVVFDGRDIAKAVSVLRRLQAPRQVHPSDQKRLAAELQEFLDTGIETTYDQLRQGTARK